MDVIPFLSAIILIATVATILLAVLSYAAFKFRDRRKPKDGEELPVYFRRYLTPSLIAAIEAEAAEEAPVQRGKGSA